LHLFTFPAPSTPPPPFSHHGTLPHPNIASLNSPSALFRIACHAPSYFLSVSIHPCTSRISRSDREGMSVGESMSGTTDTRVTAGLSVTLAGRGGREGMTGACWFAGGGGGG